MALPLFAQTQFPYNVMVMQPPGHRGFRRLLQSVIKQLAQTALSDRYSMPVSSKIVLFHLVSEYSVAASRAAAIASQRDLVVELPDDSFVLPRRVLMLLYLDYLVFGYATFELAKDVIVYADPRQFTSITIQPDGDVQVKMVDTEVSDRVGVIARCPNPFAFGQSVPELIPQTFLFLLSFHGKLFYDLSPYRKPDILIVTNETLSSEELLARRRRLIEQAEEDYGSFLLYTHGSEERPQVIDLSKGETAPAQLAERLYENQVGLLQEACGIPIGEQGISYPISAFYASFQSELQRLLNDKVTISFSSEGEFVSLNAGVIGNGEANGSPYCLSNRDGDR